MKSSTPDIDKNSLRSLWSESGANSEVKDHKINFKIVLEDIVLNKNEIKVKEV